MIKATVTTGSLQDGLLQDLYFERKLVEFSEHWAINNGNEAKWILILILPLLYSLRGKSKVSFSSITACASPVTPKRYGRKFPALSVDRIRCLIIFSCH